LLVLRRGTTGEPKVMNAFLLPKCTYFFWFFFDLTIIFSHFQLVF